MYILGKPHTNFQLNLKLKAVLDGYVRVFKYNVKTTCTCIPRSMNNNRYI